MRNIDGRMDRQGDSYIPPHKTLSAGGITTYNRVLGGGAGYDTV